MAELKTKENKASVKAFLYKIDNEQKRQDGYELVKLMEEVTKQPAKMWGASIIGFGSYHYKYESGREGDMCKIGFSPRKANISLYVMLGLGVVGDLLSDLGKHKAAKGCLYVNKLADIDK